VWDLERKQKLLFFTGKGGTGKSFLSAIAAVNAALDGKKVLLIDAEGSGTLARIFERDDIGYQPSEVHPGIFLSETHTDEALAEYLNLYAKIPTWAKITPLARLIDLVSHAAPGVKEILITGKICFETKKIFDGESDFDLVIVDSPSSGHVVSLLDAPQALSEIVSRGAIQSQTQWMSDVLSDERTSVVVVCAPDDIVVSETKELVDEITSKTSVAISQIVINKDIAHALQGEDFPPKPNKTSTLIADTYDYYIALSKASLDVRTQFPLYSLASFPLIAMETPSIRSLVKHHSEMTDVSAP
jgi:anion-transporting  ArsA/GET3 family ATPase